MQPQFADPCLRRFNMITVDYVNRGGTRGSVPDEYSFQDVARDVATFMDALRLPPVIVYGASLGGMIAVQLGLERPEKVRGLFVVATLGGVEVPAVAAGRQQVFDLWAIEMEKRARGERDDAALEAIHHGGNQLAWGAWNAGKTPLLRAISQLALKWALRQWDFAHIRECRITTVEMFTKVRPFAPNALGTLATHGIPVSVAYGGADIAYPAEMYEGFASQMRDCGVSVQTHCVEEAPHWVSTTHPEVLNPIMADFILDRWNSMGGQPPPVVAPPVGRKTLATPFDDELRQAGWTPEEEEEEEETVGVAPVDSSRLAVDGLRV
ncbi:Alpha/Beta hydrolase protein [Auriculariales sp. MPI-PUGE-AT-0066]|nr:Alpha/Beta hydrolase protein [Auriculariales sp. MPI-PUGE-AT-0066]